MSDADWLAWSSWSTAVLPNAGKTRRLAFIAGRVCAERAMTALTGTAHPVSRGPEGEPLWPPGVIGSITHTDRYAYAAVASAGSACGLGIDSEPVVDDSGFEAIATLCATAAERAMWLRGPNRLLAATAVFSAKEAFYKAIYAKAQRRVTFDDIEVTRMDLTAGVLALECRQAGSKESHFDAAVCRNRVVAGVVHTSCVL